MASILPQYSITFGCRACGAAPLHPAVAVDLPVLVCDSCGKTVETATAQESCRVDVWVPTTDPRVAWRGYGHLVTDGVCRTCRAADCRHAKAAAKLCSPSPDGPTPVPRETPKPSPPTRARVGRVARID